MRNSLARAGLALGLALAASPAWAMAPDLRLGWTASGDIVQQRKDVDEVSRPPPPSGPATPVPYCGPGSPICP